MTIDTEKMRKTIICVIDLLVRGEYRSLEVLSGGNRLTAEQLQQAVAEYGCRLVPPPTNTIESLVYGDVGEVKGSSPTHWPVYVILWTAEEGRSDLTLDLTLVDSPGELYSVEINDLHVL